MLLPLIRKGLQKAFSGAQRPLVQVQAVGALHSNDNQPISVCPSRPLQPRPSAWAPTLTASFSLPFFLLLGLAGARRPEDNAP